MLNWILSKLPLLAPLYNIFDKARNMLDGKKAYIGGLVLLLQGILALMTDLETVKSIGDLISVVKNIATSDGMKLVGQGLGIMGLRAAISKNGTGS